MKVLSLQFLIYTILIAFVMYQRQTTGEAVSPVYLVVALVSMVGVLLTSLKLRDTARLKRKRYGKR